MDEIVRRAMAKWPNVPAVFGWLALDRRGRWRIGGQLLSHRATAEFINRNYQADAAGRWYFQNGPQRVFVDLDYTPWVFGLDPNGALVAHTGARMVECRDALLDQEGSLIIVTEAGPGVLDDRDLVRLGNAFRDQRGQIADEAAFEKSIAAAGGDGTARGLTLRIGGVQLGVGVIDSSEVALRFGFVAQPRK